LEIGGRLRLRHDAANHSLPKRPASGSHLQAVDELNRIVDALYFQIISRQVASVGNCFSTGALGHSHGRDEGLHFFLEGIYPSFVGFFLQAFPIVVLRNCYQRAVFLWDQENRNVTVVEPWFLPRVPRLIQPAPRIEYTRNEASPN
jgi:hypothetical protein